MGFGNLKPPSQLSTDEQPEWPELPPDVIERFPSLKDWTEKVKDFFKKQVGRSRVK